MSNAIANQLFLAYLGRPADTQWRNTTGTLLNGAAPSAALQTAFYNAAVADGVFATTDSPSTLVNKIFNQIFGFGASTFEQTQWGNLISTGQVSAQSAAWTIFSSYLGATNVPASYQVPAQSKLVAADAYVTQLGNDAAANAALSQAGSAAATSARTFLSGITTQAQAATAVTNIATTVSAVGSGSTTGSTFTLTSSTNAFTGTSSGDTFNADLVNEGGVANVQTLNANDSLNGGAGTDTLNATLKADVTPVSLASIEIINVANIDDGAAGSADINLTNAANVTTIKSSGNVEAMVISGVQTKLTGGLEISNTSQNLTVTTIATALSAATDELAVKLNSVTGGTLQVDPASGANGYETITINSTGSVNNTLTEVTDGAGTSWTTLKVTGDKNLTITNSLAAEVVTVDASAFTGNLNVTHTNAAVLTLTGGTGNDTFVLGGTYVGGTSGTTRDTINGGNGTDSLSVTSGIATAISANQSNLTSIETLVVSDELAGSLDATKFTTVTTVNLAQGGSAAANVLTVNTGTTVKIDVDIKDESYTVRVLGTGVTDTVTLDLAAGVDFLGTTGNADTFTGIETLNIKTASTAGTENIFADGLTMTSTASTEKVVITGANAVTFTDVVTGADEIDASAATGVITLTGGTGGATIIKGGTAADGLRGSSAGDIVIAGAGADVVTMSDGDDTVTLDAGADIVSFVGSADAAALNAGSGSTITDFTFGTDKMRFDKSDMTLGGTATGASTAIGAGDFFNGAAASMTAGTAYTVTVLSSVGYSGVGTAEDAVAAQSTSATRGIVIFFDTTLGYARAFLDADIDADGNLTNTAVIANLSNITTVGALTSVANTDFFMQA
ncbi:MAG: beta strand repeat-containing protein [Rhodospirillales bacterium]